MKKSGRKNKNLSAKSMSNSATLAEFGHSWEHCFAPNCATACVKTIAKKIEFGPNVNNARLTMILIISRALEKRHKYTISLKNNAIYFCEFQSILIKIDIVLTSAPALHCFLL